MPLTGPLKLPHVVRHQRPVVRENGRCDEQVVWTDRRAVLFERGADLRIRPGRTFIERHDLEWNKETLECFLDARAPIDSRPT